MGKDGSYYPEKGRDGISKIAMDYLAFLTNGAAQAKPKAAPSTPAQRRWARAKALNLQAAAATGKAPPKTLAAPREYVKLPTTRSKYAKFAFSRAVNPAQDLINERPVKGHVTVELAKRIVSEWEQQAHDVDAFADEITERVAYGDVSKRSKAYAGIHEASGMIKELEDEIRKAKA